MRSPDSIVGLELSLDCEDVSVVEAEVSRAGLSLHGNEPVRLSLDTDALTVALQDPEMQVFGLYCADAYLYEPRAEGDLQLIGVGRGHERNDYGVIACPKNGRGALLFLDDDYGYDDNSEPNFRLAVENGEVTLEALD